MINYAQILITNYVGKEWALNGDDYAGLDWLDSSPKPTKEELDALWESTQAKIIADQQAAVEAKQTAIAKLTVIGLTADEIAALGVK
jgi:hypothetical protein